ncbi:Male sterility NAD-binding [Penicillium cf. griseofulvum]|uniref:Male sterility NAD-binding n=1 Tax=Penicillium cf. griseofulvum TaxID=2972120 RepID=A0A9W9MYP2_9EURO|nr:Male sterility NAD-binding [Penicillium cf. griseofulvum]KAJ5424572.1 Male sterility NAD-binding [Penicillium cf. griseofulvum]
MAEWRDAAYLLDFIGHTDNQVKHAGFRRRSVRIVVQQPPLSKSGMHSLVACALGVVSPTAFT